MSGLLASIGFVGVLLGLLTAIIGLINQRRIKTTAGKVQEISVQVDGRLSILLERQAQLLGALHDSGTPIPARPLNKTLAKETDGHPVP